MEKVIFSIVLICQLISVFLLVWMLHSRTLNNLINKIHQKDLRLVYKDETFSSFAALAITGAIKGTSQLKLYKELGFESLKFRRWFRRLFFL